MGLQEGMKERFHWELHNTTDVLVTDGGFSSTCKNSMDVKEGDRHLSYWKDSSVHSKIHIFFSTLLFAIVLIVENITNFIQLENCKSSVSFYWIQSCVIVFSFRFWGRKRNRRWVKFSSVLYTSLCIQYLDWKMKKKPNRWQNIRLRLRPRFCFWTVQGYTKIFLARNGIFFIQPEGFSHCCDSYESNVVCLV